LPPNTYKHAVPLVDGSTVEEPSPAARGEAKIGLEEEEERQRRAREKIKAEKRSKIEAAQAEVEREKREKARIERKEKAAAAATADEEAERLRVKQEAEEKLRRQKEEQERGLRLQKSGTSARLKKKEVEEDGPTAHQVRSPPTSPRRHGGGIGLFSRKQKDDVSTSPESAANAGRPRQTSDGVNRDISTIRPGGGGAVLGIDAPKSAINAGDRVGHRLRTFML
jgi:hypothetical protein